MHGVTTPPQQRQAEQPPVLLPFDVVKLALPSEKSRSMFSKVGEKILLHFNASRVTFAEINRENRSARIISRWEISPTSNVPEDFSLATYFNDRIFDELHKGRLVSIDDVERNSHFTERREAYAALNVRSSLHSPYIVSGKRLFTLSIHKSDPHYWTADEKDLCRELTSSIYLRFERAWAEESLRESEGRLRMATEAAQMFVWEIDLFTKKIKWADNAAKIIGAEPEQMTDEIQGSWFFIHADDRERIPREFYEHTAKGSEHFVLEYRGLDRDGGRTFWRVQSFTLFEDGRPARLVGTTQNISAQRESESLMQESEERLRLVLESVSDHAIVTQDSEMIVTGWNPGAETVFGFSAAEIIGRSSKILFTPEDINNGIPEKEIHTALEHGRAEDERWRMRKDGSRFYASGVMSPLKGIPGGFVVVARDLTERQKTEDELREAREELELRVRERTAELGQVNNALRQEMTERVKAEEKSVGLLRKIVTAQEEERGRIARDLHDQLGQRLTALRLNIASLKDACADEPELISRVQNVDELGAKLDRDVNFLAWELRPRALDDLGLVSAVENFAREWSQHFDFAADFHSNGLAGNRLNHDIETNLYRITQEALNNIFKHSQATSVSVILEKRGKEVVLVVEDNGVGFDTTNIGIERTSGRGLGLIGMRERAAIVGGAIEIESTPGGGTTVFVRVPANFADKGVQDGN